jgi:hypothetical protein
VRSGELADGRHARARAQHAVVDARGNAAHDLVAERFAAFAREQDCIGHITITVREIICISVLVLYWPLPLRYT